MQLYKVILTVSLGACALCGTSALPQQSPTLAPRAAGTLVPQRRLFRDDSDEFDSHERLRHVTAHVAATNAAARFAGTNAATNAAPNAAGRAPTPTHNSRSLSRFHHSFEDEDNWFSSYEDDDAKYDFNWDVSDEDTHFDRHEAREGDNTKGSYSVMLPDGRRQVVTYYVDGTSGYVAKVRYEGTATSRPRHHSNESPEDFD